MIGYIQRRKVQAKEGEKESQRTILAPCHSTSAHISLPQSYISLP
jgi:hypothetical protein